MRRIMLACHLRKPLWTTKELSITRVIFGIFARLLSKCLSIHVFLLTQVRWLKWWRPLPSCLRFKSSCMQITHWIHTPGEAIFNRFVWYCGALHGFEIYCSRMDIRSCLALDGYSSLKINKYNYSTLTWHEKSLLDFRWITTSLLTISNTTSISF